MTRLTFTASTLGAHAAVTECCAESVVRRRGQLAKEEWMLCALTLPTTS